MARAYRRLRAGHAAKPTARALGWSTWGVRGYLERCGGIRPAQRRRSPSRLSLAEREEISRGLAAGSSLRAIAAGLGRAPSRISREVLGNGDGLLHGLVRVFVGARLVCSSYASAPSVRELELYSSY